MAAQMFRFTRKFNDVKFVSKYLIIGAQNNSKAKIFNQYTCRWLSNLNGPMLRDNLANTTCVSSVNFKWLPNKMAKPLLVRWLANESKEKKDRSVLGDLIETQEQPQSQLTVGAKVVQTGRDATYFGIILVGFAVTGALLWYVFSELFLGFSPNKVYAYALKQVLANRELVEELGEPVMGHGETNRRGRRRHVSYQEYIVDGENYMRVRFYVTGQKRKGTVHVDVKQGSRGNTIYRYIFVELTDYPQQTIIILDNR
ncbi:mitochondrial import inner membrane translocase subunit Tim21-like [Actinia tenebrosa]|uniref:Mitochondrial import inner membrane translocase subunit Tim21 n=1 Tax=Actinia tenebrosa TaxID=6105 RepID=A0A6P8JE10_ACTTE|nr:mitochondrial import inner membrane translocase subunit Tim21-like [Actinia tenebrosa]